MALSTSRTVVTQTGLSTGSTYNVGGVLVGTSNLHTVGIEIAGINVLGADTPIGSGSTIYDDGGARFSGIVTATSFHGDISQATGAAAGLGTALSQTQTDPLNKVYYTNRVLSISTTTTVDPPATASAAYTQYTDLSISNGADLIIKDGDELVPDVLGISTTALPTTDTVTNTGGRLRVAQITNANANGAPNFPNGLTVTGIVTASTLNTSTNQITVSDSAVVGSAVTTNNTGIDATGIITATSFRGDGSQLTGIDSSSLSFGGATKIQANNSGVVVTGILTTTQYKPGEIIETIAAACDGRTVSVQSGNYTITNVTAIQNATTSWADMNGSALNYTPPAGTRQLVYTYRFQWECTSLSGISHFRTVIDGVTVIPSQITLCSNYASTNWHHAQFNWTIGYTFDLNAASPAIVNQGQFSADSWTSPKIIKTQFREYGGGYEVRIHANTWWDGASSTSANELVKPQLFIQAIA